MKPETLEALLIDRSLGELTPEAAELLQEHLARDPAAAHRGDELDALLGRARQAVAFDRSARLPALPRAERSPGGFRRPLVLLPEILKLAACVGLGLAAGWYVRGRSAAEGGDVAPPIVAQAAEARPGRAGGEGVAAPDFWSLAYLQAHRRERAGARAEPEDRIPWEAFVK